MHMALPSHRSMLLGFQAAQFIVVLWGVVLAGLSLRRSAASNVTQAQAAKMQALSKAVDYLIDNEVMDGRQFILRRFRKVGARNSQLSPTKMSKDEVKLVRKTLRAFDRTRFMANHSLLDPALVEDLWAEVVLKIWYVCSPFIDAERDVRGHYFLHS